MATVWNPSFIARQFTNMYTQAEVSWNNTYGCWCCSVGKWCPNLCAPWTAALQTFLSFTVSLSLLKLMPVESMMHPTISSSVVSFSSCLKSFSASGSFLMSQFFASGGQSIGASASASVLPMNIQDWFPFRWTGWISLGLAVQGTLKSLLQHQDSLCSPVFSFLSFVHAHCVNT